MNICPEESQQRELFEKEKSFVRVKVYPEESSRRELFGTLKHFVRAEVRDDNYFEK